MKTEEHTVTVCHDCCIVISNADTSHIDDIQAEKITAFETEHGPLSHKEQSEHEQFKCEACGAQFHDDTAHVYVKLDTGKVDILVWETWTPENLESLPTLATGQADDLKLEFTDDGHKHRVWLCRVTNRVSVEYYNAYRGKWQTLNDNLNAQEE